MNGRATPVEAAKIETLNKTTLEQSARKLARIDPALGDVLRRLGPPPLWHRPATFATFVRIILEQQVSLASAKSTFDKLHAACEGKVSAKQVAALGDQVLRSCGLSRQKSRYSLALANDVLNQRFRIGSLRHRSNDEARKIITERLGLGDWSADVFLLMALLRADLFPVGDLALIKGMTQLDGGTYDTAEKALERAQRWRPYRSVATRMIWQLYLSK